MIAALDIGHVSACSQILPTFLAALEIASSWVQLPNFVLVLMNLNTSPLVGNMLPLKKKGSSILSPKYAPSATKGITKELDYAKIDKNTLNLNCLLCLISMQEHISCIPEKFENVVYPSQ